MMILNNLFHSTGSFTLNHGIEKVKQEEISGLKSSIKQLTTQKYGARRNAIHQQSFIVLYKRINEYKDRISKSGIVHNPKKEKQLAKMEKQLLSNAEFLGLFDSANMKWKINS